MTGAEPVAGARNRRRDRIALATWPSSTSARIGGHFRIDADALARNHPGIAPVAVIGWAVAAALRSHPDVNRRVVLFAIRSNPTVRISFAVDTDDDLQVAIVDRADELDPRGVQRQLVRGARAVRRGEGPFSRPTALMSAVPVALSRPALRLWSVLTAGLGVPLLGLRSAPFGAALVSSVATFDVVAVDPPFVPFARCPLVLSVGAAHPAAVVRDGAVAVANVIDVSVAADHRICDGGQFASFAHRFVELCGGGLPAA